MTIKMHHPYVPTIEEMSLMVSSTGLVFEAIRRDDAYSWMEEILRGIQYRKLKKRGRGIVRLYLQKLTGYSRSQTARCVSLFLEKAEIKTKEYRRTSFACVYGDADAELLAETDNAHGRLSGPATRRILEREYAVFHRREYERLAGISVSHIYNLRGKTVYREKSGVFTKTRPVSTPIGERRKPSPDGKPGYIRVDTVHQGDAADGSKGVYHINLVDEVTQWEVVVCVERISEQFLVPALEDALGIFPFSIVEFHSDNGSEFINRQVAEILDRMLIRLTKSRARHTGDNALVEGKNGSVIRKSLGYTHIPQKNAEAVNVWHRDWMVPYLNFHRPCAYGEEKTDPKGKRKRVYAASGYRTPYEKFRSLENASQYLKPGVSFAALDAMAHAESDTMFAKRMQEEKRKLFKRIFP